MKNPEEAYKTGVKLLNQGDYDMASLYFESSGENFQEAGEIEKAIESYKKAIYCFEILEKTENIEEIKKILQKINK